MKTSIFLCAVFLVSVLLIQGFTEGNFLLIDDFEAGLRARWEKKVLKGETEYTVIDRDGNRSLKAESRGSASGLIYSIKYDIKDYPVLSWRWKVEKTLEKGDASKKEGDDYAARIYVIFPHWIPTLTKSVTYIWANRLPKDVCVPNAYYSKAMMIAVQSGNENCGKWIAERRNLYEDYKRCFGEDPPKAGAIAIMSDTDNTLESATAYYDDIRIEKPASR